MPPTLWYLIPYLENTLKFLEESLKSQTFQMLRSKLQNGNGRISYFRIKNDSSVTVVNYIYIIFIIIHPPSFSIHSENLYMWLQYDYLYTLYYVYIDSAIIFLPKLPNVPKRYDLIMPNSSYIFGKSPTVTYIVGVCLKFTL